ncbi:MAG: hypothetical protein J2P53_16780, partial [Bradyrhizobiaceae bacterium]|nr:hypothetical protein [Bradyrhizobiaceae bacterium]
MNKPVSNLGFRGRLRQAPGDAELGSTSAAIRNANASAGQRGSYSRNVWSPALFAGAAQTASR